MNTFSLHTGTTPLLISMPHDGTALPDDIATRMTALARTMPDTDWHVHRLYEFADKLGASVIRPRYSRYLIDLNRPPDGQALYPGAPNTGLCPTLSFDGEPLYLEAEDPDEEEIAERRARYWQPYHDALGHTLGELRERHGVALLFDAHTIRSRVERLFEGRLPDINLGSNGGESCGAALESALESVLREQRQYSWVVNGRFKGGYITRHYGRPARGVHAVQLEQAQASYMEETPPYTYRPALAERIQPLLERLLSRLLDWARR